MACNGDTGNGATISFSVSSLSLAVESISIGSDKIDSLNFSTLDAVGYECMIPTDLKKPMEITVDFIFDTADAWPAVDGTVETCVITWPKRTGETTAANLTGTGYITEFKPSDLKTGEVQKGQLKFQYDGGTGPSFTKAV